MNLKIKSCISKLDFGVNKQKCWQIVTKSYINRAVKHDFNQDTLTSFRE